MAAIPIGAAIGAAGIAAAADNIDSFLNWGISRNLNQQTQAMDLEKMAEQAGYDKMFWDLSSQFNSAEAQKNRDFQERMSNTAYQRAIEDMQKAGINPASLGGAQVSGASTPSGATGSASNPQIASSSKSSANFQGSNMGGVISNLASSALYGMIAKDRDASRYLAREIQDNAKHAYRMQEINERINGSKAVQELKNQSNERIAKNRNQNITLNKKADREARHDDIYFKSQRKNYEEIFKKNFGHKNYR